MLEQLGRYGHNTYVYAPKDDPKHRAQWREPYEPEQLARFEELAQIGRSHEVLVGFGISPGLDIDYSLAKEVDALKAKLEPCLEAGIGMVCLLFDDIPVELRASDSRFGDDLASAQAHVANELRSWLGGVPYFLVPTDYIGTRATPYLRRLGKELDVSIPIAWTGPEVTSPSISAADAQSLATDVGRPLVLCDNYPVNDGPMRLDLKLGPYPKRDAALAEHCVGLLLNPMIQCRASTIAVATAGRWCADAASYDSEAELDNVVGDLGGKASAALGAVVDACRWSQVDRRAAPRLVALADDLFGSWMSEEWWSRAKALADLVETHAGAAAYLEQNLVDRRLWADLAPWCAQQAAGAGIFEAMVLVLLASRPDLEASWNQGRLKGRVLLPWDRGIVRRAASALERWQESFGSHLRAYGGRVGLAPLVHFGDVGQIVGPDVMFNENVLDAFVLRVMSATREVQESWPGGAEAVGVEVDGESVVLDENLSFSLETSSESHIRVHWGKWGTERAVRTGEPVLPLDQAVGEPYPARQAIQPKKNGKIRSRTNPGSRKTR